MSAGDKSAGEGLDELKRMILVHIYRYGPDTPWLMARRLMGASGWAPRYDEEAVDRACRELEEQGLLERYRGPLKRSVTSSIKPWLKVKSKEMGGKPPGIYYDLTREGRRLASRLYKEMRGNARP